MRLRLLHAGDLSATSFDTKPGDRHGSHARQDAQRRIERREVRAIGRQQRARSRPRCDEKRHRHDGTPYEAESRDDEGGDRAEADHHLRLERDAVLGSIHEVALNQVVSNGRLHLDADEQRIERCGHDLSRTKRRRPDEHDAILELVWIDLPVEDIGR